MTVIQAIILGIVQGLTEFLPISSSGHLLLVPWLFNWHFLLDNPGLNKTFDVALHLGTFVAVLVYFWREVGKLIAAWVRSIGRRSLADPMAKLAWLLILSTVPAAIGFMYLVDHIAKLDRELDSLTWFDAVLIGCAQALALCPGVSRSGVTMMTGMLLRLDRESAARYSFLLSIPVIGGAAAYKALEVAKDGLPAGTAMPFAVGMVSAAISGLAAIWFVLAYLKRHNFNLFVLYRIVVGVAVLILIVAGVRSGMGI
jgi:undecaprenyl-diphosphatase